MEIKIGDVKRAYVNKDGDISIKNLVFKIKLHDPTSMPPCMQHQQWRVYTPYDVKQWLEPGMKISFSLGVSFMVPQGFVMYLFGAGLYTQSIDVEEMFLTPDNKNEVVLTVTCLKSFYLRKYMHIASFIVLPVLNTYIQQEIMYASDTNEYR